MYCFSRQTPEQRRNAVLKQLNRVGGVHAAEKLVHEYKTLKGTNVAETVCNLENTRYEPFDDIQGEGRTVTATVDDCRQRCQRTAGCAFFSHWRDGGCHLSSTKATPVHADGVTAGAVQNDTSCNMQNTAFSPRDNTVGGGRTETDLAGCRLRCQTTPGCAYFSHWLDGGCHLSAAGATPYEAEGVISGPPHCDRACTLVNTQYTPKDDIPGQGRTVTDIEGCRQRCADTPGCAYFSHWADGGCHLSSNKAHPICAAGVTAGSGHCGAGSSGTRSFTVSETVKEKTSPTPAPVQTTPPLTCPTCPTCTATRAFHVPADCGSPSMDNTNFASCKDTSEGAVCAGVCNHGYSGTPNASCSADGSWKYAGSCTKQDCGTPFQPHTDYSSCGTSGPCHPTCKAGFHGSPSAYCSAQGWEYGGSCVPNLCEETSVPNSDHEAGASIHGTTGESIQVTCNPGFSGGGVAVCRTDGTFEVPKCKALAATEAPHCDPASVAHSDHDAEDSITGKIGDKVLVKCHKGYAGQGYAVCKATGKFDLPTCNAVPHFAKVGCYKDTEDRTMSAIDTKVPNVDECGYKAYKEGFRNFALQSPGQCWGSNVEDYDREGGARTCSHDQDDYARDMGGPWSNAVYTFGVNGYSPSDNEKHLGCSADGIVYADLTPATDACRALGNKCAGVVQSAPVYTIRKGKKPLHSATGQTSFVKGCDGYCSAKTHTYLEGYENGDETVYHSMKKAKKACDNAGDECGGITRERRQYTVRGPQIPKQDGDIVYLKH